MKKIVVFALLGASASALAGHNALDPHVVAAYAKAKQAGADADQNPHANDPASIDAGAKLFEARCAPCHGSKAKGDGVTATALDPKPADLTDDTRWDGSSIGVKHWIVLNGIDGTGMGPTGLTPDEAWLVLAYLEATYHRHAR